MQLQKDTNSVYSIAPDNMLFKLMEQYVKQVDQLHHKQQELRKIHAERPLFEKTEGKLNNEASLVALCYYKDKFFNCLREITAIEQVKAETLKTISRFAPNNGKISTISFKGEEYIIGFARKYSNGEFILLKAGNQSGALPTYLPTYLPTS